MTALAVVKASLFVGYALLVGAGFFARFVAPVRVPPGVATRLRFGAIAGALLIVAAGAAELAIVAAAAFGRFDGAGVLEYALYSRHGSWVAARSLLALSLLALGPLGARLPRPLERPLFVLAVFLLAVSTSVTSHSGTMGVAGLSGDTLHLIAAAVWAGVVLSFAWAFDWRDRARLPAVVRRVGTVGIWSVATLGFTGAFLGLLHVDGLDALATPYGVTLTTKTKLVGGIVALAFLNRYLLLPLVHAEARSWPLKAGVRLEAVLLTLALVATGSLTTLEPPHEHRRVDAERPSLAQTLPVDAARVRIAGGTLAAYAEAPSALTIHWIARHAAGVLLEIVAPAGSGVMGSTAHYSVAPNERVHVDLGDGGPGVWTLRGQLNGAPFLLRVRID